MARAVGLLRVVVVVMVVVTVVVSKGTSATDVVTCLSWPWPCYLFLLHDDIQT